jgi:hypothetical protein
VLPKQQIDKTNIILACLKSDKNAVFYLDKYSNLPYDEVRRAISSLMLTANCENTFFHPDLWNYFKENDIVDSVQPSLFARRGSYLLMNRIQLSETDLFKKEYSCSALEIDN